MASSFYVPGADGVFATIMSRMRSGADRYKMLKAAEYEASPVVVFTQFQTISLKAVAVCKSSTATATGSREV